MGLCQLCCCSAMAFFNMSLSIIFILLALAAGATSVDSDRDMCDQAKAWCTEQCRTLSGDASCTAKCGLFVSRTFTCSDLEMLPQPMLGYVNIPEQKIRTTITDEVKITLTLKM